MKPGKSHTELLSSTGTPTLTLGEYAHQVIQQQYRHIVKRDQKVLADKDPEHLHQMRVGTRRLRTALQVFGIAVELPKTAGEKAIATLARTLGQLRDLDVQIADLRDTYQPQLPKAEQKCLSEAIAALQQHRKQTFALVEATLTRSRYQDLKAAYETWLDSPRYTALASLPLRSLLPDLLSPLLSELLLHPGWLVRAKDVSAATDETLHDLRKACKHARYQAEFFAHFYDDTFEAWIEEIKAIQEQLGKVHDTQVLLELLTEYLPKQTRLSNLQDIIHQTQRETMENWETIRQKYLDPSVRYQLHHMVIDAVRSEPRVKATVSG